MSRRASLWWWIELPGLREEPDGWRSSRSFGDGCCRRRTPEMGVVLDREEVVQSSRDVAGMVVRRPLARCWG